MSIHKACNFVRGLIVLDFELICMIGGVQFLL